MIVRATKRKQDVVLLVNRRKPRGWTFPESWGRADEGPEETVIRLLGTIIDVPIIIQQQLELRDETEGTIYYYLCKTRKKDVSRVPIRGNNIEWKSLADALEMKSENDRYIMAEAGKIDMGN